MENKSAETCWLYRLESETVENGLWYNGNSEFVLGVAKTPNCATKDLPMGYDARYKEGGKDWFSACKNKEDLTHWYSPDNAKWLVNNGFVFTKYLACDWRHYDKETVFLKGTAIERIVIDVNDIWDLD